MAALLIVYNIILFINNYFVDCIVDKFMIMYDIIANHDHFKFGIVMCVTFLSTV